MSKIENQDASSPGEQELLLSPSSLLEEASNDSIDNEHRQNRLSFEMYRDASSQSIISENFDIDDIDEPPEQRSLLSKISKFLDGPNPPVQPHVTPIFPSVQYFPRNLMKRWPKRLKVAMACLYLIGWFSIFWLMVTHSILETPSANGEEIPFLTCSETMSVWKGKNYNCGINGENCGASELKDFVFKCPASCKEDGQTWSETAVGDYQSIYRQYVIGGNNTYRADSFICPSALHHGVASNRKGFCGRIKFNGPRSKFISETGGSGIESMKFESIYPYTYSFDDEFNANFEVTGCRDLRFQIIWFNIIMSMIFAYFVQSGALFYWTFSVMGFWTVILASNPPLDHVYGGILKAEIISLGFRRFMPYMFGCYVIYVASGKNQLTDLEEALSKCTLWVGGFWVALLENYTFSALPVNRLTLHDINSQRGGWITVISIAGFIFFAAFGQAYIIWRLGKFKKYIMVYILFILALVYFANFQNQTLRLHHYILGLVLLPGVGFKTTPSLLFSGLLFGLYVSGVARWDFDSIIQTEAQLNRGDALNFGGLPTFNNPSIEYSQEHKITDISISWEEIMAVPKTEDLDISSLWNGYSVIVNDLEQYRGNSTSFSMKQYIQDSAWGEERDRKVYIRLAYANLRPSVGSIGDYTKAAIINLDTGEWTDPIPGPS